MNCFLTWPFARRSIFSNIWNIWLAGWCIVVTIALSNSEAKHCNVFIVSKAKDESRPVVGSWRQQNEKHWRYIAVGWKQEEVPLVYLLTGKNLTDLNNILHQPAIRLVQLAIHRQCSPVSSLLLTTLPSLSQQINCNYYCKYLIIIVIIIKQEQRWRYKNEEGSEDTHLYQDILSSQSD